MSRLSKGGKSPITLNLTLVGNKTTDANTKDPQKEITTQTESHEKILSEKKIPSNIKKESIDVLSDEGLENNPKFEIAGLARLSDKNLRNIYENLCRRQDQERIITQQIHALERKLLEERILRKEAWNEKRVREHNEILRRLKEFDATMFEEDCRIEADYEAKLEPLRRRLEMLRNDTAETIRLASMSIKDFPVSKMSKTSFNQLEKCSPMTCSRKKKNHRVNNKSQQMNPAQVFSASIQTSNNPMILNDMCNKPRVDTPKLASALCEACEEIRNGASASDILCVKPNCETCAAYNQLEKLRRHLKGCGGCGCGVRGCTHEGSSNCQGCHLCNHSRTRKKMNHASKQKPSSC